MREKELEEAMLNQKKISRQFLSDYPHPNTHTHSTARLEQNAAATVDSTLDPCTRYPLLLNGQRMWI